MTPDSDLGVVHRAGRIAAVQASLRLPQSCWWSGRWCISSTSAYRSSRSASQLSSVALAADDVTDPPPGMILVLRDLAGKVRPAPTEFRRRSCWRVRPDSPKFEIDGAPYRAVVMDKPEGRVVALLDLGPHKAGRSRLLLSLGVAELAGIVASIAVVTLLTRRSIRPLAEALALQRRFVADASHELRAPLTVLHTRIQLLARRFDDGDAQQTKEQIDALASDTRVLGEVIEDLLASASMTSDNAPQDRIDLVHARASGSREHGSARRNGRREPRRRSEWPAPVGDFVVLGSGSALRRAITSLIDNALAHEHRGGTIAVALRRHHDHVLIDVRDDGVGIDPGAIETLFNRFSHGKTHTAAGDRPRYGIGLALVREIAHAHRGHITVAQTPGGGATFTLTIPAAPMRPRP